MTASKLRHASSACDPQRLGEHALELGGELVGELGGRGAAGASSSTGGTIGSPTTTATRCGRGKNLPLGRMCSLPPMPTGTIGTPSFTARYAAPSNRSARASGPPARVPSGNTATGSPRASTASSARSAPRSAVPRSTWTAPSAVKSRSPSGLREQLVLGEEADRARGDERGERHVEDRAVRRGDDVRAGRRDVLLADHAHPEHDLAHARARRRGRTGRSVIGAPSSAIRRGTRRRSRRRPRRRSRRWCRPRSRRARRPRAGAPGRARRRPGRARSSASRTASTATVARPARPRRAGGARRARRRRAVRNTFTGASGNTTVPMSRPSTTPPPCSRDPRPLAGDEDRAHRGMRRHRRDRAGDLGPADLRATRRGRRGARPVARARSRRRSATAAHRVGVVEVDAGVERRERDRAVHRAGVEHVQAERVGDPARHRRLPRARRAVDGDDPHAVTRAPVSVGEVVGELGVRDARPRCQPAHRRLAVDRVAPRPPPAIAMRWSPWLVERAPAAGAPPRIDEPVGARSRRRRRARRAAPVDASRCGRSPSPAARRRRGSR